MTAKLNGWIWKAICLMIGVAFGAGGAVASINHLSGIVDDHEDRIRTIERGFGRIEGKIDQLIEQAKQEVRE